MVTTLSLAVRHTVCVCDLSLFLSLLRDKFTNSLISLTHAIATAATTGFEEVLSFALTRLYLGDDYVDDGQL